MAEATENFWDICPPEIMLMIFEYLDVQSLYSCLVVNKRFHTFAAIFCQKKGWSYVIDEAMTDKGTAFTKKSYLDHVNIARNACLWEFVKVAQPINTHNYERQEVTYIHVYREQLIVVCPDEIMFYNIKYNCLAHAVKSPCFDYDENDHMKVMVRFENGIKVLYLSGKWTNAKFSKWRLVAPDDNIPSFQQYRLHNHHCFIHALDNTLFRLSWDGVVWEFKFLARFFGYGTMSDITIYKGNVYALLNWGGLLVLVDGGMRFKIGPNLNLPTPSSTCAVMYNSCGAIISVPRNQKFKLRHPGSEQFVMECPELTSVLKHNDMLILGYAHGQIEIYMGNKLLSPLPPTPELSFNIQTLIPQKLRNPSILGLEVAETPCSPTLFVVTQYGIHQIKLVYPDNIVLFLYD